jgi:hypothetical protein
MQVPRLSKGKGYKGPEALGCFNTGMAPAIFHSRSGKYVVGPEMRCRDAMRMGLLLISNKRSDGKGGHKVYIYKTRGPAVAKFTALCEAQMRGNDERRNEMRALCVKARRGDIAAALALGDF